MIVRRLFVQRQTPPEKPSAPAALEDFLSAHTVVVLGDPGLGKTTALKAAAETEPGAAFVPVGRFLAALSIERWRGKTLYLDGLDEQRAKVGGQDIMDALLARLDELGRPKVRLSCRTLDWHGGADVSHLSELSEPEPVVVLDLLPLGEGEIAEIAAHRLGGDGLPFMVEAGRHGIGDLLRNPETLGMVLSVYKAYGGWPRTRRELFERSLGLLLEEVNERHARSPEAEVPSADLAAVADRLAALALLSGLEGFALHSRAANDQFPHIRSLGGDTAALAAAAKRRVFVAVEPERMAPCHRMLGEFMTARHLARRVAEGLPLSRVLALLTGSDGGTLSHLRGVFAWLVSFLPTDKAEIVVKRDPFGAVVYGDAASWSPGLRLQALKAMMALQRNDPWFAARSGSLAPLGGLVCAELVEDFRRILRGSGPISLHRIVLEALVSGPVLPDLGDDLLAYARDNTHGAHLRARAVAAFDSCCPERRQELVLLLNEVNDGVVGDEGDSLRGELLPRLYPDHVGPEDIPRYLSVPCPGYIGAYSFWFSSGLVSDTPEQLLPRLADALAECDFELKNERRLDVERLVQELWDRLLRIWGDRADIGRFWRWTGIGVRKYDVVGSRRGIRDFLERRPDLLWDLFVHWWRETKEDEDRPDLSYSLFWRRLGGARLGLRHVFPLLELAAMEPDQEKADFLFGLASARPTTATIPSLADVFTFVDTNPRFRPALARWAICDISDWRWEQLLAVQERRAEQSTRRQGHMQALQPRIDHLRNGKLIEALDKLAQVWFGLFIELDRDATPEARLMGELGEELTEAVIEGFVALLQSADLPSPRQVAAWNAEGRRATVAFAVLAGMDIVHGREPGKILVLPEATLGCALALNLVTPTGSERAWPEAVMEARPELATAALREFWLEQLAAGQRPTGLYRLDREDAPLARIGRKVAFEILEAHPDADAEVVRTCLHAALDQAPAEAGRLARNALERELGIAQRTAWLATAFVLTGSGDVAEELRFAVRTSEEAKWSLHWFTGIALLGGGKPLAMPPDRRTFLVRLLLASFPNVPFSAGSGWVGEHSPEQASHELRRLIDLLARDPAGEISAALVSMRDDPELSDWRDALAHAAAEQAQVRRDAEFLPPTLPEVLGTLSNEGPANPRDCQALVVEILKDLDEELSQGPADGWKGFWNTNKHGHPDTPKVENDARDFLLTLLRPRLQRLGLHV